MKQKSTSKLVRCSFGEGGFLSLRALIILFLFTTAACSILTGTLLAFLRSEAAVKASQRTLTFEERVSYQRAIEEVYWRHRIWPKERPDPKPSLDAVMSQAQLEKKVTDYLRNSQALDDYWHRPITAEELQTEMDRMAKHTKQPDVLRELFEALGNDPFVIAECLARPALAERLVKNWYAYDQRIHGELKQRAKAELGAHASVEQMKELGGRYSEIEFVKSNSPREETHHDHGVKLTGDEWDDTMRKLAAMFNEVPQANVRRGGTAATTLSAVNRAQVRTGVLSVLQEDENCYYALAVIEKTDRRLKLARISWPKEPIESWLARSENQIRAAGTAAGIYALPITSDGVGCVDDSWRTTAGPPEVRAGHTAVWTGSEMIVWGGGGFNFNYFNTGGRYNPATDNWTGTNTTDAPSGRADHTSVWTGNEMIVWGGYVGSYLDTGGRYNPVTDTWTATSTTNAPSGRGSHTTVWTGSEMIVWGGFVDGGETNTGGRYDPGTDSWSATNTVNAPDARHTHTAVWTGSEMVVWGGVNSGIGVNSGGRYNPSSNSWAATSTTNAPDSRYHHTAVWTGGAMIVWGGDDGGVSFNTGGSYNPGTDTWAPTSLTNAPSGRSWHTAIWTGGEMIVWGGFIGGGDTNSGGRYNPETNSWIATSTTNAPAARASHAAVWSGSEMIVWGGSGNAGTLPESGGRYDPITDNWLPTGKTPSRRARHTAVWTGSEMIVWGGFLQNNPDPYTNTGGTYTPSTDSWAPTSTTNTATGRERHTAVWSGGEMIIWGGYSYDGNDHYWNTGGRYNPVTNSWMATSTTNTPIGRVSHAAVWTASEMIVWGGYFFDGADNWLNTGGRYNPSTNSWTATSTANAPSARVVHKPVWTGNQMIVWGGSGATGYFNTGGKYDPNTNNWTATSTTNAPSARTSHTAVWTGNEMVVWGGYFFDGQDHYLNTGGRYNPVTDSWTATSAVNVPDSRANHTAIWTGGDMVVWGGHADFFSVPFLNTGGRYNAGTDSWAATSINNAPDGRYRHTAVWTGNEMIIWGGILYTNTYTSSGGRYCAQSGPTPTPTPCTGRCEPTPRPRPTPRVRPTPR